MRTLPAALLAILTCPAALAQADNGRVTDYPVNRTTTDTFDRPASAARANEWPWEVSVSAGAAWVGGDDLSDSMDFAAQLRLGKQLSNEVYVAGSYLFAIAETQFESPLGGPDETEDHDLHIASLGVGLRLEVTEEILFFVEPRIGVIFGDADTGPVAGFAGGVELAVTEGVALRFEVLGLAADTSLDTAFGDADVDSVAAFTLGVTFEF